MIRATILFALCCAALPVRADEPTRRVAQVPGYCIPPDRPLLDEASLEILDLTMGEELTRYMNEAQSYSLCLDATKQQLYAEINGYIEQYQATRQ